VLVFSADLTSIFVFVRAAKKLHETLLMSILRCDMKFFESTPIGRILNRFSKDLETIESKLPTFFQTCVRLSFICISILAVISINTPIFIVVLIPIFVLYYYVQVRLYFNICICMIQILWALS
jgi:ATP-binding cassette subfamily C (CFTR/MRP) protein 1